MILAITAATGHTQMALIKDNQLINECSRTGNNDFLLTIMDDLIDLTKNETLTEISEI